MNFFTKRNRIEKFKLYETADEWGYRMVRNFVFLFLVVSIAGIFLSVVMNIFGIST